MEKISPHITGVRAGDAFGAERDALPTGAIGRSEDRLLLAALFWEYVDGEYPLGWGKEPEIKRKKVMIRGTH